MLPVKGIFDNKEVSFYYRMIYYPPYITKKKFLNRINLLYSHWYIYPKDSEPFMLKGWYPLCEDYLIYNMNHILPALVHRYVQYNYNNSYGFTKNTSYKVYTKGNLNRHWDGFNNVAGTDIRIRIKKNYQGRYIILLGTNPLPLVNIRRIPRKWIQDLNPYV